MEEKALKTTIGQRIIVVVIAVLLLTSTVLAYLFIVMTNGGSTSASSSTADSSELEAQIEELTAKYDAKSAEIDALAKPLSDQYFDTLNQYRSRIKAYNKEAAQNAVLATEDLTAGTGRELTEGDTDYLAFYVGWCPDGSIFDSSFDNRGNEDEQEPTALVAPIDASMGLIEGWNQGVVGMKLGGVRQITMQGALAYGDSQEICGETNSPLKFLVLPVENTDEFKQLNEELQNIYLELYSAYVQSQSSGN